MTLVLSHAWSLHAWLLLAWSLREIEQEGRKVGRMGGRVLCLAHVAEPPRMIVAQEYPEELTDRTDTRKNG